LTANKKILVTGGTGFIGSHTVLALIEAGYSPVVIDNFSNSHSWIALELENIAGQSIPLYEADCTDEKQLAAVFDEEGPFEGVIHFAALKAVGESVENPLKYYKNNLESLVRLLEQMERTGTKNLVFSSSCTVYGIPSVVPITENEETKEPQSPYGATKIMGEQIIKDAVFHGGKVNAVLLRYFNPIGAHPSGKIGELPMGVPNNLVPYVAQTAAGWREVITINGSDYDTPDGTCIRDYIHVVDLAEAHVRALSWFAKGKSLDVFNLGTGKGSSVAEVISLFEEVSKKTIVRVIGPRRKGDVPAIWANADKAKAELGWLANYSLKEALHHAWLWQENLNTKK
jgi:UDP-glucose 4-epimerase